MTNADELLTRITALEQRVYELEVARLSPDAAPTAVDAAPLPAPSAAPAKFPPPPPAAQLQGEAPPMVEQLRAPRTAPPSEVILRWVGVALVFLAAAFLVSTAVSRGWIGPELQLVGAVAIGLGLVAWALRLSPVRDGWALAVGHGGVAVLGTSAFLGYETLDLYGMSVALAATAASALVAAWLSIRLERASIAGHGVFQAVWVPVVIGLVDFYSPIAAGAWLTVVILAAAFLSWQRRWPALRLTLFAIVAIPLLVLAEDVSRGTNTEIGIAVVVGLVAIAVFVLGPAIEANAAPKTAPDRRRIDLEPLTTALDQRLYSILPTWTWGLFALLFFGQRSGASWLAIGIAALAAVGLVALRTRLVPAMFAAGVVGASVLGSIGLAGVVEGPGMLVALTVQAIGLTWLAVHYKDLLLGSNAAIIGVIAAAWGGGGIINAMFEGATLGQHLAYLVVVAAIVAAAVIGRGRRWFPPVAIAAWLAWLGWLAAVLGELPQGQMAVSIAWAICGAALFVVGMRRENRQIANVGLITLCVTVIKLVTVDLDAVDTMWRAGLFFVVGIGLLRLGLLVGGGESEGTDGDGPDGPASPPAPGDGQEAGPLLSSHD